VRIGGVHGGLIAARGVTVDEVKAAKRAVVRYLFEDHPDLSADSSEARQLEAQKGA
jgi:hypothetical protein